MYFFDQSNVFAARMWRLMDVMGLAADSKWDVFLDIQRQIT